MTLDDALRHAQALEPLDLVARLEHMQMHLDRCDAADRPVWQAAIDVTRNGVTS